MCGYIIIKCHDSNASSKLNSSTVVGEGVLPTNIGDLAAVSLVSLEAVHAERKDSMNPFRTSTSSVRASSRKGVSFT